MLIRFRYYPYGLKISTLSSKKLGDVYEGSLKNNYLYQGAYSELDDDIGWNDFALRNYDAQIGRWVQQDPYQEFASPYVGMGDDPINLTDPSGGSILDGLSAAGRAAVTTIGGAIIGTVVGLVSGDDDFTGTLIGAGIGLVSGLGSLIQQITLSMGIQTMNVAVTVINSSVKTEQTGRQAEGSNTPNGPSADNENDNVEPSPEPEFNYPIFTAESKYPDIQRIDLLYWVIAPPEQKFFKDNQVFLRFRYEQNVDEQKQNGKDAEKSNRDCFEKRLGNQQCHEVPYKSTIEGGATSIMMPADGSQNQGHGASLMWFYKTLKDGDYFLVPVGETPKPPKIPSPVLVPKMEPERSPALPQKITGPRGVFPVGPVLVPIIRRIIERYGWRLILFLI